MLSVTSFGGKLEKAQVQLERLLCVHSEELLEDLGIGFWIHLS